MKTASFAFYGFCFLIAIVVFAVLLFNPSRHDRVFLIETFVFAGGVFLWSALTAWYLGTGKGLASAFLLVVGITVVVIQGVVTIGITDEKAHPVLAVLRMVSALYVLFLWGVTVRACFARSDDATGA